LSGNYSLLNGAKKLRNGNFCRSIKICFTYVSFAHGLNSFVPFGSVLVAIYFTAAAFTAGLFYKTELSLARQ